ncbi:MAG: isoprenylcysteine carboxylmethyltransferase family protein, partial [Candidatus Hydrogenedentes bacterium]|nr:isoprenylcysteine carboxylmethyltransferase family protein [Candidatus Hydrogenedentota bacterium]
MKLAIKVLVFTVLVPGTVVILGPAWVLRRNHEWFLRHLGAVQCMGTLVFLMGVCACAWCVYGFAVVGHGTPAPIDPPK